jgi:hypothetical protein
VFTARYGLSSYIKQTPLVFKGLICFVFVAVICSQRVRSAKFTTVRTVWIYCTFKLFVSDTWCCTIISAVIGSDT